MLLIVATVSGVAIIIVSAFIVMAVTSHKEARNDRIKIQADIIIAQAQSAIFFNDANNTKDILNALEEDISIQRAVISLEGEDEKNYAAYSRSGHDIEKLKHQFLFMGLIPRIETIQYPLPYNDEDSREIKKTGQITIDVDLNDFYKYLVTICIQGLLFAVFCTAIAIKIVGKVVKRTVKPILLLAETAKEVANKRDYTIRAEIFDKDEIGTLTENINEMMAQIQWRDESLEKEVKKRTAEMETAMLEAKAANKAKSEFVANISHEIRTPMNAICNMNRFVLETELTPKQREHLTIVDVATSVLLNVINDTLDLSKIEAGQLELEEIAFDLGVLLNKLTSILATKEKQENIEFILNYPLTLEHCLIGDPVRLGQVLTNLVSNAVKFTKEGHIITRVELLEESEKQVTLFFSVSDTGLGIRDEYKKDLFDSFSQADVSTTRKYGGTGLGLAISQKLVNLMGGRIDVESQFGKGSRFFFTLTFNKSETLLLNHLENYKRSISGLNILLLNESTILQEVLENWFHELGIVVNTVSDLQTALLELEKYKFDKVYDLFLINWKTVKINEAFSEQAFESFRKWSNIPAILMTTPQEHDEVIGKKYYYFADNILNKPLKPEDLVEAISLGVNGKGCIKTKNSTIANRRIIKEVHGETHILLVEDNEINQQVACELLERQGIQYSIANNGKEALELLSKQSFDLILMDIQMPEMDGYQASIAIRKNPKNEKIPIIAMTAHAMRDDIERCLASGMNDHISKPIEQDVLYNVLVKYLGINNPLQTVNFPIEINFPKLNGIDFNEGFKRVNQNKQIYSRILQLFIDKYKNSIDVIQQALAIEDFKTVKLQVHTLKGTGANLGAKSLSATAGEIETLLESGKLQACRELLDKLDFEIKFFIKGIQQIIAEKILETETTVIIQSDSDLKADLMEFVELTERHDFSVNKKIQKLIHQNKHRDGVFKSLQAIEQELIQFKFEKALDLLKTLINTL